MRWTKNRTKLLNKVYVSPLIRHCRQRPKTAADSASPYAQNNRLREVELIGLGDVEGPEDVILDAEDNLYTGTRHGDIVRFFAPDYKRHEIFAHIGGHPLGLAFDRQGNLVTCVGGMGVYSVSPAGDVRKVTDEPTAR